MMLEWCQAHQKGNKPTSQQAICAVSAGEPGRATLCKPGGVRAARFNKLKACVLILLQLF